MPTMSAIAQLQLKPEEPAGSLPAEQQLHDAHRMEASRLVGAVAHDFNNLLTGMVLCSELILAGLDKESRLRHFAEEIRSAGAHGAGLIQQLLAVARQRPIESRLLCLNDVISEVSLLLTRLIGENIELVAELAADLGMVCMDPTQAQQTILNLALNARDAMPNGGRIVLSTRNWDATIPGCDPEGCDSWIEFAVSDTGCGMNAETRSRLFEPFFTTKEPGQGNGLGLATVHRIVTHEGGNIEVESEAGKGTRVVVYLPRARGQINRSQVSREVVKTGSGGQNAGEPKKAKSGRGKSE